MPLTTTHWNACDAVIKIDNASNTLIDISGSSNSAELEFNNDIGEFKTFGSKWKGRIQCGKDATLKLSIVASKDAAEAMRIALDWFFNTNGAKTVQIDAPDSTTGSDRISGEFVLESFSIPLTADEATPVMCELNLLPNGAVSWTQL